MKKHKVKARLISYQFNSDYFATLFLYNKLLKKPESEEINE